MTTIFCLLTNRLEPVLHMLINHFQKLLRPRWIVHFFTILEVAADFYYALDQLYNNANGCFNSKNLNILGGSPLFIFGESYAGKYVPAISKKIV
jgi:hypothetical protein